MIATRHNISQHFIFPGKNFHYRAILQDLLHVSVGVLIFFNPFPKLTAIEEIAFYSSFSLFVILILTEKERINMNNPLTLPMGLFFAWSVVGLFFALNVRNSCHDIYAHLFKYLAIFYLLVNVYATKRRFQQLTIIIIVSTFLYAATTIFNFYQLLGNPIHIKLGYRMPWEIPSNVIGVLTVFASLLCLFSLLEKKPLVWNVIPAAALIILILTTLATQARSAFGAMIAGFVIAGPRLKKIILFLAPLILFMILVMPVKNRLSPEALLNKITKDDRINTWYTFYQILKDHPLAGIGFGFETYQDNALLAKYNARVPEQYRLPVSDKAPHNFLVDTAVRTGYVGLSLFLFIIFRLYLTAGKLAFRGRTRFIRNWALAMLAALSSWIIQSMFENTLSGPPAVILIMIMAMTVILWQLDRAGIVEVPGHAT